jgi:hypothetical protein
MLIINRLGNAIESSESGRLNRVAAGGLVVSAVMIITAGDMSSSEAVPAPEVRLRQTD